MAPDWVPTPVMGQLVVQEGGWELCCSLALTMRAHGLSGTLATWAEQVRVDRNCLNIEHLQENNFSSP